MIEDFYSLLGIKASQVALRLAPVVGGSIDVYELFIGKDIFTQRELSQIDKAVSAVGLGLSFLPVASEATEVLKGRKFIKLGENIIEYGQRGTRIIKGSADDILDTENRVNRSTSEGKILPVNLQLFAEGTGNTVFKVGSKSEAIQALKELPDAVQANVKRFVRKSGSDYTEYAVDVLENGNYQVKMIKPGNVSGHAEYFKIIDPDGNTIETFKDTFDNLGELVHRKYK